MALKEGLRLQEVSGSLLGKALWVYSIRSVQVGIRLYNLPR